MSLQAKLDAPLAGKVALVTGGGRGIGAVIAKRLAADGTSFAVTYSKGADAAASVVKKIERGGGKAIATQADTRAYGSSRKPGRWQQNGVFTAN